MIEALRVSICTGLLIAGAGCSQLRPGAKVVNDRQGLQVVLPKRIEIVKPYTGVVSFDDDDKPDGIELVLQAVSCLDDPGLMLSGHLRIELFEYVKASAQPEGRRLDQWNIPLESVKDQQTHWNNITQMYEFRLGTAAKPPPKGTRYVLAATLVSPLGERLTDQMVITYPGPSIPTNQ